MFRFLSGSLLLIDLSTIALAVFLAVRTVLRRNGEGPLSLGRLIDRMILPFLAVVGLGALVHIGLNLTSASGTIDTTTRWILATEVALAISVLGVLMWGGRSYLSAHRSMHGAERALQMLLGTIHAPAIAGLSTLTSRENDILAVLSTGETSDRSIADRLHISEATAATHVRNILAKTGLHDRKSLILLAVRKETGSQPQE